MVDKHSQTFWRGHSCICNFLLFTQILQSYSETNWKQLKTRLWVCFWLKSFNHTIFTLISRVWIQCSSSSLSILALQDLNFDLGCDDEIWEPDLVVCVFWRGGGVTISQNFCQLHIEINKTYDKYYHRIYNI